MSWKSCIAVFLLALINSASSYAIHYGSSNHTNSSLPLSNTTIYDFGLGIWPENLNIRSNGQILVSLISTGEVWQINPFKQQDGVLVHKFEGKGSCLGIVETYPDIFHVIVGDFITHPTFAGTKGSYGIWELDFTTRSINPTSLAIVTHIVDIPDAEILDGLEVLNSEAGLLVGGDLKLGVIYTINVKQKTAIPTINNTLLNSNTELSIGVDGIKLLGSTLYFTNAAYALFGSVPINIWTGYPTGPVQKLPVTLAPGPADDFIFDKFGNAYLTNAGSESGLYLVQAPVYKTKTPTFLTSMTGPTACRFGRTKWDEESLYVTSTGGDFAYVTQSETISSKLSRVDLH